MPVVVDQLEVVPPPAGEPAANAAPAAPPRTGADDVERALTLRRERSARLEAD